MKKEPKHKAFDKNGKQIREFDVLKVYHFTGKRRKKHYMYKWVRIEEYKGECYLMAQHLDDDSAFFEKGSNKKLTGYHLCMNKDTHYNDTEIVQTSHID